MTLDLEYYFDFRHKSAKDPWHDLEVYKPQEEDHIASYLQKFTKLPDQIQVYKGGYPKNHDENCSVLKFCGINDTLPRLFQLLDAVPDFVTVEGANLALYDILHREDFQISPAVRAAWGPSILGAFSESDMPSVEIMDFIKTAEYVPDLGSLVHQVLHNPQFPSIYYLNQSDVVCSSPWGVGNSFAVLNRRGWGQWVLAVHKNHYIFNKRLPGILRTALQPMCPRLIKSNPSLPPVHKLLPELGSSLFYTFADPIRFEESNKDSLCVLDFYREVYSVGDVTIKNFVWDFELPDQYWSVALPRAGTTSGTTVRAKMTYDDYRVLKTRNFQLVYDQVLRRCLHAGGIMYKDYSGAVRHDASSMQHIWTQQYFMHMLSSIYLFLFSKFPNFVRKVIHVVLEHHIPNNTKDPFSQILLEDTGRHSQSEQLLLVVLRQNTLGYLESEGRFHTKQVVDEIPTTYLTRICSEFRSLDYTDLAPVNYICKPESADFQLTSKLMVIILRCKIATSLKWKPFYYMADLILEVPDTIDIQPQALAGLFSNFVPLQFHDQSWIVPITVHTPSLGYIRVLLVIHPHLKLIEYYDTNYSQEALRLVQYELYHALLSVHELYTDVFDFRTFDFVVMIKTFRYRKQKSRPSREEATERVIEYSSCVSNLFYFITFATQTADSVGLSARVYFLNKHLDTGLAQKMQVDLFSGAYTWFSKYKQNIHRLLWDHYQTSVS